MKSLRQIIINNWLPKTDPEAEILHIMHEGYQLSLDPPQKFKDVRCMCCGGNKGFYIPHLKTWSCAEERCININTKKCNNNLNYTPEKCIKPIEIKEEESMLDLCDQTPEMLSFFRQFAKNPEGFLLLSGWNGTGKTYAAKAIKEKVCNSYFTNQSDLNFYWLDEFQKWNSTTHLIEEFIAYKLLILDDIGTRTPSEAFMDFLYVIMDKRYNLHMATIVTTNLNSAKLRDKFGDAFVSRIASGKIFKFEGKDRRFIDF